LEKVDGEKVRKILALAKELAKQNTDKGLDKATEILLRTIDEGFQDPELLVTAATYLLQSSWRSKHGIKKQAIDLVDRVAASTSDDISVLEAAVHCYELTLNDFPEKFNEIIRLNLRILDLDPENIDAMVTLASHREHPGVALSLDDAIRMVEWAQDVAPGNNIVAYTLSRLYMEAGKYEAAKKLYNDVLQNDEANPKKIKGPDQPSKSDRARSQTKRYRKYGRN
jgi:tetratricopeptide (TPR) repeat protein